LAEAPAADAPDPRRLGTLVHRLLEHDAIGVGLDEPALRQLAHRLLSTNDGLKAADSRRLVDAAVRAIGQMANNQGLARLLQGPRWHEVPVIYNDGHTLWRGALDALVVTNEQQRLVLEFKTGRLQPAHEVQLALYVATVSALVPDASVTGRLVGLPPLGQG
jgi:hypothetical protein